MTAEAAAWPALGVLMAVVFVLDGWRSQPNGNQELTRSPKLRGILFLLSGGLISGLRTLSDPSKDALAIYTLAFVITTLAMLIAMFIWAFVLAKKRYAEANPAESTDKLRIE